MRMAEIDQSQCRESLVQFPSGSCTEGRGRVSFLASKLELISEPIISSVPRSVVSRSRCLGVSFPFVIVNLFLINSQIEGVLLEGWPREFFPKTSAVPKRQNCFPKAENKSRAEKAEDRTPPQEESAEQEPGREGRR